MFYKFVCKIKCLKGESIMKAANKLGKLALFLIPIGVGLNFVGYQIFYVLLKTPFACLSLIHRSEPTRH